MRGSQHVAELMGGHTVRAVPRGDPGKALDVGLAIGLLRHAPRHDEQVLLSEGYAAGPVQRTAGRPQRPAPVRQGGFAPGNVRQARKMVVVGDVDALVGQHVAHEVYKPPGDVSVVKCPDDLVGGVGEPRLQKRPDEMAASEEVVVQKHVERDRGPEKRSSGPKRHVRPWRGRHGQQHTPTLARDDIQAVVPPGHRRPGRSEPPHEDLGAPYPGDGHVHGERPLDREIFGTTVDPEDDSGRKPRGHRSIEIRPAVSRPGGRRRSDSERARHGEEARQPEQRPGRHHRSFDGMGQRIVSAQPGHRGRDYSLRWAHRRDLRKPRRTSDGRHGSPL
ncbi:hypothetical protein KCV01_g3043, partial [Aureobasidium melanogenum]